ncbi:MAG TPA: hypothetical protein VKV18_04680 [Chthonomonas sp.]|uniref:hypothetical protein n=1 Tax=Chthonomonas sp. TaxID=2282153 RepID=UPI002B4B458C|nr:hypothetical protein [Chthonomonas sp.]HLI47972.1 hypothetical protein [Chthonomonas sp.]
MGWEWWFALACTGFVIGGITAWATGGLRVFLYTLAVPIVLLIAHLFFSRYAPPTYLLWVGLEYLLMIVMACFGDYLFGLKLGRNGPDGYRHDSVGH